MQNNGFVKVFAVLLTLVCLFYISFSFVSSHYENKAKEYALAKGGDSKTIEANQQAYLDSMANEKVWLWGYTLKECREMEIGLGLDLKGGMNVILEVSVPDVLKALSDNNMDPNFNKALEIAEREAANSQADVITLFIREYKNLVSDGKLAAIFATQRLKDKIHQQSTDAEVESVLRSEAAAAIDNSYTVLRTRIDRFGVVQPNIQKLESGLGRIMIELPGIKEPQRVRDLLQGSASLEFWETYTPSEVYPILAEANTTVGEMLNAADAAKKDSTDAVADVKEAEAQPAAQKDSLDVAAELAKAGGEDVASDLDPEFAKHNPIFSLLSVTRDDRGCIVGYAEGKSRDKIDEYLSMASLPKDLKLLWGVQPEMIQDGKEIYALYAIKAKGNKAPLGGEVVTDATNSYDQFNRPTVSMTMNSEGARKWAQLTEQNIGRCIAIVLDNCVYSAPNVNDKITGGRSEISGNFTPDQTKDLANVLNSGKMPAPAKIVNEEIVGPSLGQESINQGVVSFIVAVILLMAYMCSMYGFIPGMVANGALILNVFFTFGVLASFQAALTMSGIAGMVLTLGMAVDANVLIYERTKEELRARKDVKRSLADGYSNAFSAIFDSNFTSLITGVILFMFGTGPIRGFATTLMIGIIVSFFTAVFMTRLVYNYFMSRDKWLKLTFSSSISKNLMLGTKFDFLGKFKVVAGILGVVIIVFVISFVTRGLKGGIDFTGGRNYVVMFEQPVEPETVENLLKQKITDANIQAISIGTDKKTVRVSTNYRIEDNGDNVDAEIEMFLYEALKEGNLLGENVTYELFIDREQRDGGSIISSSKVGPSIAEDIKVSAIWSVFLSLIAIGLYILLRFRNVSFSIGATVALTVDTLFILGLYSLCQGWMPFSMEIDQTFIGAILTAIGYSINDKVVIFDRIREFLGLYPKRNTYRLFNESINTTLSRTINTGMSTLVVLFCILFLGGDAIRSFAFAMIIGVVAGTFSSIFVAAPVAYRLFGKKRIITDNN